MRAVVLGRACTLDGPGLMSGPSAGEAEATKEFGKGLLLGPFNVGWLGVERFTKK